jgi:hypothetical protein
MTAGKIHLSALNKSFQPGEQVGVAHLTPKRGMAHKLLKKMRMEIAKLI